MNPDFDTFCHLLAEANVPALAAHPAEIHGLGCGLLAAGLRPDAALLSRRISDYIDGDCLLGDAVVAYFDQSLDTLENGLFEFYPCLPDDDVHDLPERVESLAAWCMGFLHGFAEVPSPLSPEAQELLQDLTEISRVDAAGLDSKRDDSENDYGELTEFVRMAVTSLFMDHNRPSPHATSADGKYHVH